MSTRGVGHTELIKEGIAKYDKPFYVVGGDQHQASHIARQTGNRNAIPISIEEGDGRVLGRNIPMVLDNFAVMRLCENYEARLDAKDKQLSDMNREVVKTKTAINRCLRDIENFNFFERIFGFWSSITERRRHYDL
jgi:hypothetical protein